MKVWVLRMYFALGTDIKLYRENNKAGALAKMKQEGFNRKHPDNQEVAFIDDRGQFAVLTLEEVE